MARRLDRILVIDVESTCWEGPPPRGQISEIIEVGLCVVDVDELRRIEKRAILVRPQTSEVSEFCTRLTTITPELAASGISLAESLDLLRDEYRSEDRLFASWGDYDRNQFHRNCDHYRLKYPFGPTHLNVKTLFAVGRALSRETGIDAACELAGTPLEGTHHRGVDDAWNIAGLLCELLKKVR
jgi:inhibitor of KinA sporulation pathway (predicted exonuclease)